MAVDIKSIKDKIRLILQSDPQSRDSDLHLIHTIWKEDCQSASISTLDSFFEAFTNGKLTNFESIRRCRQKWQELHPELRVATYKERKAKEHIIEGDLSTLFNA